MKPARPLACLTVLALIAGCSEGHSETGPGQDTGPTPVLAQPESSLIPTIDIAPAVGWPAQGKPAAAPGFAVNAFASGLDHPRTVYVLPNGDVLVAETNAPPKPDDDKGLKGKVAKMVMKKAGAGVASANRITLLRDADGDGVAETRSVFLQGSEFTVRHGPGRRHVVRGQHRCGGPFPVSRGRDRYRRRTGERR